MMQCDIKSGMYFSIAFRNNICDNLSSGLTTKTKLFQKQNTYVWNKEFQIEQNGLLNLRIFIQSNNLLSGQLDWNVIY